MTIWNLSLAGTFAIAVSAALMYLPFAFDRSFCGLPVFAMFYGLDRISTVPPTSRLSERAFGRENAALIFGWIQAAYQIGAESATCGAGLLRTTTGTYAGSFFASGCVGVAASMLVLLIGRSRAEPISMQVLPARS